MSKIKDKTTEEMIIEKGLTAPRVTKTLIDSKINSKDIIKSSTPSGAKIYIGLYEMENGFCVSGKPVIFEGELQGEYPTDMKANIITHKTNSGSILRFAYIEYPSGLVTIGRPSASVSAENDNEEIGVKIAIENCHADRLMGYAVNPMDNMDDETAVASALENAFSEIWAFEGYLLATKLKEGKETKKARAVDSEYTFGDAVALLKAGSKMARKGWNGKDMFIYYVASNKYPMSNNLMETMAGRYDDDLVPYQAYIAFKTVDDTVVPWLASQTDILAEDWVIVE